jgi:hypothetical protein
VRLGGRGRRRAVIELTCAAEDKGVIAEPMPARRTLPDWFRRLPGVDGDELSATNNGLTVKRCLPFADAMAVGWIIPLAATVRLEISDGGKNVTAGWEHDREMVSTHAPFQLAGNPYEPRPPMKFHNYWTVRTAPGWSSLFLPMLNRSDAVVEVFSGLVDTDVFQAPVNLPFVAVAPDGVHTLPKGTPLVQVVPIHRHDLASAAPVRAETSDEHDLRQSIKRNALAGEGWYRRAARSARTGHALGLRRP